MLIFFTLTSHWQKSGRICWRRSSGNTCYTVTLVSESRAESSWEPVLIVVQLKPIIVVRKEFSLKVCWSHWGPICISSWVLIAGRGVEKTRPQPKSTKNNHKISIHKGWELGIFHRDSAIHLGPTPMPNLYATKSLLKVERYVLQHMPTFMKSIPASVGR